MGEVSSSLAKVMCRSGGNDLAAPQNCHLGGGYYGQRPGKGVCEWDTGVSEHFDDYTMPMRTGRRSHKGVCEWEGGVSERFDDYTMPMMTGNDTYPTLVDKTGEVESKPEACGRKRTVAEIMKDKREVFILNQSARAVKVAGAVMVNDRGTKRLCSRPTAEDGNGDREVECGRKFPHNHSPAKGFGLVPSGNITLEDFLYAFELRILGARRMSEHVPEPLPPANPTGLAWRLDVQLGAPNPPPRDLHSVHPGTEQRVPGHEASPAWGNVGMRHHAAPQPPCSASRATGL
ncbi:hypothetical protein CBR_g51955 [Chara braunii]|uniref:Uncharacterized protein n=1 Tax=Chara braunii TaxID=69332 RepID=A0A388K6H7_CHABU|nr:hypothetical protein CBR_g51955 [Chara braunii]|eukprot:GBG65655.1 hypothetical protein CBR_g51955 [Chara braunii]